MEGYVGIADGSCRSIDNSEKAGISSLYETSVNCATHIFYCLNCGLQLCVSLFRAVPVRVPKRLN